MRPAESRWRSESERRNGVLPRCVSPLGPAAIQVFRATEGHDCNDNGTCNEAQTSLEAAGGIGLGINEQRNGLRLARNVAGNHDGGAKLTQTPGECQESPGDD